MRSLTIAILPVLLASAAGCGPKVKTLGKTPAAPVSSVLAINAGDAPENLALEGTMFEKCPQAGCWFRLDDGSGVIKVDTKEAGFVVTSVPLNRKVKVAGKLRRSGDEVELAATGLTY